MQLLAVVRDRADADACHQVRERALHQVPVFDHVGDAGGGARVVLQHVEVAVRPAHEIGTVDVDVGPEGNVDALHFRAVVLVADHQVARHDRVVQDFLVVVDVPEKVIERGDPLLDPGFQPGPVAARDHPRDHVEGQDAVDRVALGIDGEGDPEVIELQLGVAGSPAQFLQIHGVQPLANMRRMPRVVAGRAGQFAVESGLVVAIEKSVSFRDFHIVPSGVGGPSMLICAGAEAARGGEVLQGMAPRHKRQSARLSSRGLQPAGAHHDDVG